MARNKVLIGNAGIVKIYDKTYKPKIEIYYPDEDDYFAYGYDGGMIKHKTYDSEFIGYSKLHWSGFNGGSVSIVSQQLVVSKSAVLSGSEALRTIFCDSLYKVEVLVTQLTSGEIYFYYGDEKILFGTANSIGQKQFQFIALTTTTKIIIEHSTGESFSIDNIYITQEDEAKLINPGDFEFDGNEEDDFFFQPIKYNLSFKLKSNNQQRYESLLSELQTQISIITLNDEYDLQVAKLVIVETESVYIKKEITIKTKNIRSVDIFKEYEKGNPPTYLETYLNDFFRKLNPTEPYDEVIWISDWEVETDRGTYSIKECKMSWKNLYSTTTPFTTKKEIVKAVLNNLASYLIEGVEDNKLYVMPIFFNNNSQLFRISDLDILEIKTGTRISSLRIQGYDGRKIEYTVHNGNGEYIEHPVLSNEGGEKIDNIEVKLVFPFPCNGEDEYDSEGYSSSLFDPEYPVITSKVRYLKDEAVYSAQDSFVNHCIEIIEAQKKSNRNILKLKLKGCQYQPHWFYQLRNTEKVYRVLKLKRNRSKNYTGLTLIECLELP